MKRHSIKFEPSGATILVDEGTTILDAAHGIDLRIDHVCGGACACATCHVFVRESRGVLMDPSEEELEMLTNVTVRSAQSRLACQTEVTADMVVEIP